MRFLKINQKQNCFIVTKHDNVFVNKIVDKAYKSFQNHPQIKKDIICMRVKKCCLDPLLEFSN